MFYILHFSDITVISESPNPKAHIMGMNSGSWKATFTSASVLAKQQLPRALLELKKQSGSITLYILMGSQNTQRVWLQGAALASQLQTMESKGDECHRGQNSYSQPHPMDFSTKYIIGKNLECRSHTPKIKVSLNCHAQIIPHKY